MKSTSLVNRVQGKLPEHWTFDCLRHLPSSVPRGVVTGAFLQHIDIAAVA
jgi:hypothetical protein